MQDLEGRQHTEMFEKLFDSHVCPLSLAQCMYFALCLSFFAEVGANEFR